MPRIDESIRMIKAIINRVFGVNLKDLYIRSGSGPLFYTEPEISRKYRFKKNQELPVRLVLGQGKTLESKVAKGNVFLKF